MAKVLDIVVLTPDEVRLLDNKYAILFIRGERPIIDLKYDILKHPRVIESADGKGGLYEHGELTNSIATISITSDITNGNFIDLEDIDLSNYEIIYPDEIDDYFKRKEEESKNEK